MRYAFAGSIGLALIAIGLGSIAHHLLTHGLDVTISQVTTR